MAKNFVLAAAALGCLLAIFPKGAQAQPMPPMSCIGVEFPGSMACIDYLGAGWNPGTAGDNCANVPGTAGGEIQIGVPCDLTDIVGMCLVDTGAPEETTYAFYGGDLEGLAGACQGFLGGQWLATLPVAKCDHFAATAPGAPSVPACIQYTGDNWTVDNTTAACSALDQSVWTPDTTCGNSPIGFCTFAGGTPDESSIHYYVGDGAMLAAGCEGFGGGVWTPAEDEEDELMQEALDALNSGADVTVTPNACDSDCVDQLVAENGAITFSPTGIIPTSAFIYIPGGAVDPRAYSVAARQIAAAGYLVAIIPFPGRIAITDPMRPMQFIMQNPQIDHWAIGGHSLGGVTATIFAEADPLGVIEALAIFAGFSPEGNDLSDNDIRVYSLTATEDDGLDWEEWEAARDRLPENTYFGSIEGGNHAQFGYYAEQPNDGEPLIARDYQHSIYVGATIHMLGHLGLPSTETYERSIYSWLPETRGKKCKAVQKRLAGLRNKDLKKRDITVDVSDNMIDFRGSHSSFPEDGSSVVNIAGYAAQTSNTDITAPPIFKGELWCKMKSQEAFVSHYGFTPKRDEKACSDFNQVVFDRALEWVHPRVRRAYFKGQDELNYVTDIATETGPEFIGAPVTLNGFDLQSPQLKTPLFVPAPYGGVFYCKVWTLEAAVQHIHEVAAENGHGHGCHN